MLIALLSGLNLLFAYLWWRERDERKLDRQVLNFYETRYRKKEETP